MPIAIQTRNFAVTGKKNFSGTLATFTDGDPRIDPTFYTATATEAVSYSGLGFKARLARHFATHRGAGRK